MWEISEKSGSGLDWDSGCLGERERVSQVEKTRIRCLQIWSPLPCVPVRFSGLGPGRPGRQGGG